MLNIINNIMPFFEDCYRRIGVREYAKIAKISPPTASRLLNYYLNEGLLLREKYKKYLLFYANKQSKDFIDLSRLYWRNKLKEVLGLLEEKLANPTIILFGSLSKAEVKDDSDLDLAVIAYKKDIKLDAFEGSVGREIQDFWFKSIKEIKNKELRNNIINGYVLKGNLEI